MPLIILIFFFTLHENKHCPKYKDHKDIIMANFLCLVPSWDFLTLNVSFFPSQTPPCKMVPFFSRSKHSLCVCKTLSLFAC